MTTLGRLLRVLTTFSLAGCVCAQTGPGTHPDLTGIWNSSSATPLERPAQLRDKEFFTSEEAARWEQQTAARLEDPPPGTAKGIGTYSNAVWREYNNKVSKTMRTSVITDPPDGHIPPLTPAAEAIRRQRQQEIQSPAGAEDLGLQDQCLVFETSAPPMTPFSYNSNYQIIQNDDVVMIETEMIHDTRIIPLDRRAHPPSSVRLWLGDSIGHWEGNTLVVDSTNYNDAGGFYGGAGGMWGWDRNLHVTERFSLLDANTILYRFEVDDPTAYTKPWKGELTMSRAPGPIYEYSCHENNIAVPNLLKAYHLNAPAGNPQ